MLELDRIVGSGNLKIVAVRKQYVRMPTVALRTLPVLGISRLTSVGCWNVPQYPDSVDDSDASRGEGEDETEDDASPK